MIIAEVVPKNGFVFLRFVEPGENADKKPYITLNSMDEANGRIAFRTKVYIIETISTWLVQRNHALPSAQLQINTYMSWIAEVKTKNLIYICEFFHRRRDRFETLAPSDKSECYPYYKSNILTILNFCTNYITGHD